MKEINRDNVQEALQVVVGLPLSDMWRPIWQRFEFGKQLPDINRKGEQITRGEVWMDISGPWRVLLNGKILFGSGDSGYRDTYAEHDTPDNELTPNALAVREFFNKVTSGVLACQSIKLTWICDLRIELSQGYVIESFMPRQARDWLYFRDENRDIGIVADRDGACA